MPCQTYINSVLLTNHKSSRSITKQKMWKFKYIYNLYIPALVESQEKIIYLTCIFNFFILKYHFLKL